MTLGSFGKTGGERAFWGALAQGDVQKDLHTLEDEARAERGNIAGKAGGRRAKDEGKGEG